MKYKQACLKEKEKVEDLEWRLNREQKDKLEAIKEKAVLESFIERIEGRESNLAKENEWLKTTLRLVIVDADKIKGIARELEMDNNSLNYKL